MRASDLFIAKRQINQTFIAPISCFAAVARSSSLAGKVRSVELL